MDFERTKLPFRLAGAAPRDGRRRRRSTTVQSPASITFSRGNVDGERTGSLSPATLRAEVNRAGLIAGDETPAASPGDPSRTRLEARSLKICIDFLRQRLIALFSMEDDRDRGDEAEGEDGREGDEP
jgi:hypothetical protein